MLPVDPPRSVPNGQIMARVDEISRELDSSDIESGRWLFLVTDLDAVAKTLARTTPEYQAAAVPTADQIHQGEAEPAVASTSAVADRDPVQGDPTIPPLVKKGPGRPAIDTSVKLKVIIDALQDFADSTKEPFDRQAMPGPLGKSCDDDGSFHWLCAEIDRNFKRSKSTFEKYRNGICAIRPYAKPTDFYKRAYPVIAPKLRGVLSDNPAGGKIRKVK